MVEWVWAILAGLAVIGAAIGLAAWSLRTDDRRRTADNGKNYELRITNYAAASSIVSKIELPLLILLAPLFLFSTRFGVIGVGVILVLWVGRRVTRGYFLPRTPLDWPLAIMCAMIPVGMLVSPDMGWSVGRAVVILYGVAVYYAVVAWADSPARLDLATLGYLGAGAGMAGLALLGTAWQYKVPVLGDIVQLFPQVAQGLSRDSTGFHPNIVAGALLWVVLPLLTLFVGALDARKGRHEGETWYRAILHDRWVLLGLLVLTGGTLVLTQSRGALVGALAGIGLLLVIHWSRLKRAAVVVAVVGVVFVGAIVAGWWSARPEPVTQAHNEAGVYDENLVVRFDVWGSAIKGIEEYPLTGVGLDAFHRLLPTRYPAPSVPDTYDIGHAHNQLLQAAVDLGLPGLVGFLAVWLAAGAMAFRPTMDDRRWTMGKGNFESGVTNYKEGTSPAPRSSIVYRPSSIVLGIGVALVGSFVHGLLDTVVMVSKPGVLFWAMLGLLAAACRLTGFRGESTLP